MSAASHSRILVVDDELQIRQLLQTGLSGYGYAVEVAGDGAEAIEKARERQPDVIVVDLELPGLNGIDVCRSIRGWSTVPIIVLTVRDADHDKILALDEGADDYLTKPFSLGELLARIRVALRHAALMSAPNDPVRIFGDLRLDLLHRQVYLGDQELH